MNHSFWSGENPRIPKVLLAFRNFSLGDPEDRRSSAFDSLILRLKCHKDDGTCLYVLKGDTLHSVVDVYDAGELLVAQTGFGLLEKRQFRWFLEDGSYQGRVVTKNPIRRVYYREGMVVETRQRRAVVEGVASWWEQ